MKNRNLVFGVLALILIGVALMFFPLKVWSAELQIWIKSFGIIAPLVFILAYIITTIFMIPGSILTLIAGAVFGLWFGVFYVVIGANCGALAAYLLAKTKLREKFMKMTEGNAPFAALDKAIGENGFKMVLLTRLSPAFPFTLLNYFLGLTSVRTGAYVAGNLLGMLPATFLYVYVGSLANVAVGSVSKWQLLMRIVGLLATIGVVIYVTRLAKKAMKEEGS
jgi:uncharacterized membrane protein YdjX (TVP38/TMEM64 family)